MRSTLFVVGTLALVTVLITSGCSRKDRSAAGAAASGDRQVIQNKGSDTLVNVAQAWAETYKDVDPGVAIAVTGGGSGTGISSLLNGTVDLANASREIKDKELEMAKAKGIEPLEHIVGYDAIAVYLHANNP